ncbi:MAG: O-antigen ligase family protein, partial [Solirubrobacterales bacterium]|nr:O-antigen ligase family protein [Solirubrobacterales bacterium]
AGGGFDVAARHIAGLAVWLVVVGLLVFGAASGATLGRPLYWSAGLIGGLALLSAISSFWSGSIELSVIEADRVLVYLGFFLAAFLIAQTDERRQRFAEGLTIAVVLVALLGLGSRLLPHVFEVSNSFGSGPRLRYPLGYWNANGAMFGVAIALLLWTSRRASWAALRWLSVAAMPAVLLALYFTYSRGGLLALAVGAGCLIALSRDRLWLLATLAIGAVGTLPAVLAVQARRSLADNLDTQAAVDQGATVLLILLAGIALAVLLFAALRWAEGRGGELTGRAVRLSRSPAVLKSVAAIGAVLAIGAALAVGGRAWDQFSSTDIQFPDRPEQHFSQLSGAGRHDFWRVAIDAFGEKPILGHGAGTYEFSWEQQRSIDLPLHDAHSVYLEAFAELGIVGGLLVLALVGTLLWTGFSAWRAAPHPARERYAALFAAMLAFAVGAAFDWFWELAAMGAVFFLAAGVMVSARCAQLAVAREPRSAKADGRRYGLGVAGLGVAWIAAIALIGPLLVEREIDASQSAAAEGNTPTAIDHASRARSIEPWAASPYVQLGLLAELQDDYPAAVVHFTRAIEREDQNWQWYYLRSKVEQQAGEPAAARADLERARQLNPRADCLRTGNCG